MERQRYTYDKSHYSFQQGAMGGLITLSTIPVVAGDRLRVDALGVFRLSPLRRNLTVDARVDLFAFYVPYRHVYGDDWINFLKQGVDEAITFSGVALTGEANAYGAPYTGTVAKWLVYGYNNIWNRYFRVPTDDSALLGDTDLLSASDRDNGKACGHLPTLWSTGVDAEVDSSDLEVSTAGDVLDLTDLAKQKARLVSERRREFYAQRYNDVLARTFGSKVNIDADERPELCYRTGFWMSGYDVDGTDDASLGTYSGKGVAVGGMRMPRKFFREHGTLWLMALVRFPPIHQRERPYLAGVANPSYEQISGDPDVIAAQPPETLDLDEYFDTDAGVRSYVADAGIIPYGQHYRWHPNQVHGGYESLTGFSFLSGDIADKATARYVSTTAYDPVFDNTQQGHWQSHMTVSVECNTVVPPPEASIFAGTR